MPEENLLEGNKYFRWYWSICNRAKDRILDTNVYVERHHIYPKSIYGQNKDLVKLTAKEHYIVHLLLWWGLRNKYGTKDINTRKMAGAFTMMNNAGTSGKRYKIKNSKEYSFLRQAYIEINKLQEYWSKQENRDKQSKLKIEFFKHKKNRDKVSTSVKKLWENEHYREKHCNIVKKLWEDAYYREKQNISREIYWSKQENRDKFNEIMRLRVVSSNGCIAMKEYWSKEENRNNHSKVMKEYYSKEENRERISISTKNAMNNDKVKKKMAEGSKKFWDNNDNRLKRTGINNPYVKKYFIETPDKTIIEIISRKTVIETLKFKYFPFNNKKDEFKGYRLIKMEKVNCE